MSQNAAVPPPGPTDELVLSHDPERRVFEARDGDEVVGEAHYTPGESDGRAQRIFDGTLTRPSHRGRGVADRLVSYAIGRTVEDGLEPQATCWYVQGWLRRHPEALDGPRG